MSQTRRKSSVRIQTGPQRVSPAHQQTGHIGGCFRQQKNIRMMSPDSLMSATYAQCEPAVWYSPDHPLVSI